MDIRILKTSELGKVDTKNFCIDPLFWGYRYLPDSKTIKKAFSKARKMAENVEGICIALLQGDDGKTYPLVTKCYNKDVSRFVIFNASEATLSMEACMRVVTYNEEKTYCWFEKAIKYQKGAVV